MSKRHAEEEQQDHGDKKAKKVDVTSPFHADIKTTVSFGQWGWCGLAPVGGKLGHNLSLVPAFEVSPGPQPYRYNINIKMNDELFAVCDQIHLKRDGFCLQYTTKTLNQHEVMEFVCEDKYAGETIDVVFLQNVPTPGHDPWKRIPTKPLLNMQIVLPALKILGDQEICVICMDAATEMKYISPCGHLFHLKCIFQYLDHAKLLIKKSEMCSKYCHHSNTPKAFACPVCKTVIKQ